MHKWTKNPVSQIESRVLDFQEFVSCFAKINLIKQAGGKGRNRMRRSWLDLQDDPEMESFLESLPWRVFSAKSAHACKPGIFACYRFPPAGKQGNAQELKELRWYFFLDGSTEVLTTVDEINQYIASEKDTPRSMSRPLRDRRDRLKAIEAHIRSRDLKARKSVTMA